MTTHCKGIDNLVPVGNDFYLAVTLKSRSLVDGEVVETPFDFEAADSYDARIYGILDGTTLSTMVGLKDGSTDTVIIDAKGVPLIRAIGVEVKGEVDGRAFRAAEKGFLSIVDFNGEAKVVFTPVTGGQQSNLVMSLTFLPSAAVVGKNAYEIWKEEPGNEDKTLADFIYFLGHGESAYEIAVRYGYTGTEAEYNALYFDAVDVANTAGQNAQQAADTANQMAAQAQDAAELANAATTNANTAATTAASTVDAAIVDMQSTLNTAIAAQNAEIASKEAEIDAEFATQTALINQKQMEIGAVPSDLTPTRGSTNWVTSGGIWSELHVMNETPDISLYENLGKAYNTHYISTDIRVSVPLKGAKIVHISSPTSGYRIAVQQWSVTDPSVPLSLMTGTLVQDTGWLTSATDITINSLANYVVVSISKSNDGTITINEAFDNTSFTYDANIYKWDEEISALMGGEFINADDKIPTDNALIKYAEGVKSLTPSLSDFERLSFSADKTHVIETTIRCIIRLPRYVSRVRVKSISNGYRAGLIRFKADNPNDALINLTGKRISDTGWLTLPFESECYGVNTYILHFSKSNDGIITPSEAYANVSVEYDYGNIVERRSDGLFDLSNKTFSKVVTNTDGLDLNAHKCYRLWEWRASDLSLQSQSPQGSAIYGNYLFVYFFSDTTMRIFDLSSGELLHSYTLSGVGHGNSLQFGEVVQSNGFPYLYISGSVSVDSPQNVIYVANVSLSSATVVRTITLDGNALAMQNCAIDFSRQKLYAITFDNQYSGNVKLIRYDVAGLETSTAATFTPTYEVDETYNHLGVIQGATFFNTTFAVLTSDYEETFARLYFFDRSLVLLDTWEWKMNNDSECQGVTPIAQKDKIILVVPAWWRYVSGQTYFYRLQYIV